MTLGLIGKDMENTLLWRGKAKTRRQAGSRNLVGKIMFQLLFYGPKWLSKLLLSSLNFSKVFLTFWFYLHS